MKKIVLAFITILLSTVSMLADGVGTWKNYLSYYEPTEIERVVAICYMYWLPTDYTHIIPIIKAFRPLTKRMVCRIVPSRISNGIRILRILL